MLNKQQKITLIGGINNLFLAIIKIIFGLLGGSASLVADGFHSLSDLLSDFLVFFIAKYSNKSPDKEHPYGHKKFDTLATLILGEILFFIGIAIIYNAIVNFNEISIISYDYILIAIVVFSIISKELMYIFTLKVANHDNSKMLEANAWHHRLDSLSSIVVLIGILGAIYEYYYADKIAAIVVALLIFYVAWDLVKDAITELVETAIDKKDLIKLETAIKSISGVLDIHSLRTRKIGNDIISDVHIQVEPKISVSEGHIISISVEKIAKQCLANLTEITVHIDPENEKWHSYYNKLPDRATAIQTINKLLLTQKYAIKHFKLHYIRGKIDIDFYLSLTNIKNNNTNTITQNLIKLFKDYKEFGNIVVFYQ